MPNLRYEILPEHEGIVLENVELQGPAFRDLCQDFFNILIGLTPVDTGFCREQWDLDMVGYDEGRFINTCEYFQYLDVNPGHSKQAPRGIIKPAIKELTRLVKEYQGASRQVTKTKLSLKAAAQQREASGKFKRG